jgi:hypothetical protein
MVRICAAFGIAAKNCVEGGGRAAIAGIIHGFARPIFAIAKSNVNAAAILLGCCAVSAVSAQGILLGLLRLSGSKEWLEKERPGKEQ